MEPLSWVTNPPQAAADGRQTGREGEQILYWVKKYSNLIVLLFLKSAEKFGSLFLIMFFQYKLLLDTKT